jgi:4-amino-4-deoxy-L-arabinose transferase-like glycosyltransferase
MPNAQRLFLLSGLLSGWAMGTKMTAMVPFALLACWLVWLWVRSREGALLRAGAMFVLAGVVVASPWYVKSYLWTNNPVYPFFYELFPRSINWNAAAAQGYRAEQEFFGRGRDAGALLSLPWNVTMHGADFFNVPFKNAPAGSSRRHTGDILGGISATFLALLPLALFLDRWDRRLSWLLAYAGMMVLVWFFLTQQTRYLLPVLAPLSVVAAVTVGWMTRPAPRRAAALFLGMTLALHAAHVYAAVSPAVGVVTGAVSHRDYLARGQSDLYPALEFINALPPETRVAFFQEVRGFYCDRDYFWANPGQNTLVPYDRLRDGRELARFLRNDLKLTHALVNYTWMTSAEAGQRWAQLLEDAIRRRDLAPVYATRDPSSGRPRVVVYRIVAEPGE